MTIMEFVGCTLLAFGPIFSLFFWTIARDPLKVILFISAAFFWLVSLLLSSVLWYAVVPLRSELAFGLVFSVLFQEGFRFGYYALLKKAERGLQKFTDTGRATTPSQHLSKSRYTIAFVSGQGFGAVSAAFSLINLLADISGPGTVGIRGDPQLFVVVSVLLALVSYTLHITWTLLLYRTMEGGHSRGVVAGGLLLILSSHLLTSCITLLNRQYMYAVTVTVCAAVCVSLLALACRVCNLRTLFTPAARSQPQAAAADSNDTTAATAVFSPTPPSQQRQHTAASVVT